ncbi:MAG: hypothetical protein ACKPBF_10755 [Actinomycetota bacterium]
MGGGGATTTTVGGGGGGTTTTTVGGGGGGTTTTTVPSRPDELIPLTFDIKPAPGKPLPKDATVTLVVSTGSDVETMVLTIDLVDFEPKFDYVMPSQPEVNKPAGTLKELPATGGPRWTREQQIGWILAAFGLLLMSAAMPMRRRRRRRGA